MEHRFSCTVKCWIIEKGERESKEGLADEGTGSSSLWTNSIKEFFANLLKWPPAGYARENIITLVMWCQIVLCCFITCRRASENCYLKISKRLKKKRKTIKKIRFPLFRFKTILPILG